MMKMREEPRLKRLICVRLILRLTNRSKSSSGLIQAAHDSSSIPALQCRAANRVSIAASLSQPWHLIVVAIWNK
jgi:hypothetical protein